MSENTPALDPDTFDIDAWLDGASRPETVVEIHRDGHLLAEMDEIDRRYRRSREIPAEDRGINDETPESLQNQWAEIAQRWSESALKVRVRALTSPEMRKARKAAEEAGVKDDSDKLLWVVAEGTVAPKWQPEQLIRLRDQIGEAEIGLLISEVMRLSQDAPRPTAPFSQRPSRGTRG